VTTHHARSLAIASGKGGVGKTWFAITLAHALAQAGAHAGERVLLFDADLGLANVDIQLGLAPEHDLGAVLDGQASLAAACLHHEGGFDILAGRSGSGDLASLGPAGWERVLRLLAEAGRDYSRIVIDLGAGLDPFVRRMAAASDRLLVLATEEPTSLTDAYAVLKLHRQDRPRGRAVAGIVVNQATSRAAGQRVHDTLARACGSFLGETPELAGIVRRDDRVRDAIRRQTLLLARYPASEAGADVAAIARAL
jgi:flagellar biosynthesis protein FlhG